MVYGVPHLFLYTKMFVLVCSFEIQRLPPWQTLHNSSIKDGVQDGCRFLKPTPTPKMHHIFHVFALLWYFNAPFHVRMIYLYISSKKPDSLGKTVVKIMFKLTNAGAQGFSPRNVCLMAHYL